ncbi:transcriptional repressor [Bacteroides sp. OttesenSCG-928-M17]|nr:transcriptional repressor [Bacteroides sp. OttesenSCG-928-M17]MDL2291626.1 transcriptional repressor [Bacteroides sp. OttesenSCG-928-F21]
MDIVEALEKRGIKPTAIRILVYKAMRGFDHAFSLGNLEDVLDTVDKSTLSRTINLFHEQLLIHSIDDGSGTMKYSVCRSDCSCMLGDLHVHFFCEECHHTYCLESVAIPTIQLPQAFTVKGVNFVLKGICAACTKIAT